MGFELRKGLVLGLVLAGGMMGSGPQQEPPMVAQVVPRPILATVQGVEVYDAGFGSGIAADPRAKGYFYLLADRGPNYDAGKDTKAFVAPRFVPRIGRFHLERGELKAVARVEMSGAAGVPLTGVPPAAGHGGTGETAVSLEGTVLPPDPDGIDPEGLVALGDGGFWVTDEYAPGLVHLDPRGRVLQRITPFSAAGSALPQVMQKRRANRGFEGLALLPDGRTLTAVLEGPLENPKAAGRQSVITRLLQYDTRTGRSRQYVYLQDAVDDRNSDLAAINGDRLLLLERDGEMPGDSAKPAKVKRVYQIDLRGATDVSDPADGAEGRLFGGKTLEALTPEELPGAGIVPVRKTLIVDLLALGYPHDKPEGIALVDPHTIAISNDDDFGITEGPSPKRLSMTGATDRNEVYFIHLADALP